MGEEPIVGASSQAASEFLAPEEKFCLSVNESIASGLGKLPWGSELQALQDITAGCLPSLCRGASLPTRCFSPVTVSSSCWADPNLKIIFVAAHYCDFCSGFRSPRKYPLHRLSDVGPCERVVRPRGVTTHVRIES